MRFLFIINPNLGRKKKAAFIKIIERHLPLEDYTLFDKTIPGNDTGQMLKSELSSHDIVVAVGGDGTVNLVAKALIDTNTPLAIVPAGSGNGFARHMKIPMNIEKAIEGLKYGKILTIDTCSINNMKFISTCGLGFDAHVSMLFTKSIKRGFWSYAKIVIKSFMTFKPEEYELDFNGTSINRKAFLITCANTSQFGNNAYIAPGADVQDGMMNVVVLKPAPLFHFLGIGTRLFTKSIHRSRFAETIKTGSITIKRSKPGVLQFDGESIMMGTELHVSLKPDSLKVLVPQEANTFHQ